MVDKDYCMSSFLVFRYIVDDNKDFFENTKHQIYNLIPEEKRVLVHNENEIDEALNAQFKKMADKKLGILLSGGMDSACLAAYMPNAEAYTFRFLDGDYQKEELERAKYYAAKYHLNLHYVDIDWKTVLDNIIPLMENKGAPVHSIEPQILAAVKQAKKDGVEMMVIGDAADYVFGGMDGLHAKDWSFDEFVERYTYLNPEEILEAPVNVNEAFEKYRLDNDKIDFISLMHEYTDIESYASYENAFDTGHMAFVDPYEVLKMAIPLDLQRIRNGESKYLIRALFKMKYPEILVPQKLPMPRPVDKYFENWGGPKRKEFKKGLNMSKFTGNQKWQIWCLEQFLNIYDE